MRISCTCNRGCMVCDRYVSTPFYRGICTNDVRLSLVANGSLKVGCLFPVKIGKKSWGQIKIELRNKIKKEHQHHNSLYVKSHHSGRIEIYLRAAKMLYEWNKKRLIRLSKSKTTK